MKVPVNIQIPHLWGQRQFIRDEWGPVTYLVGPNGTGKTQLAEHLKTAFTDYRLSVRYLGAERLTGMGITDSATNPYIAHKEIRDGLDTRMLSAYKESSDELGLSVDSWVILKEEFDVRVQIEAFLSQMFHRHIRLAEDGGFLMPRLRKQGDTREYPLTKAESHGLKELISLLTFLYSSSCDCLILDEPELHLHPQFQQFLLAEIKRFAGDPGGQNKKKCFILVTHSPYILDIRTVEDLKNLIIFQHDQLPTWITDLDAEDVYRINRVLPRLNTHHKQFFFANRPVFVEGYTDQQFFTLLQELRGQLLGAAGISIIDVGGKDEVDAFYRLCERLNIEAQAIVDADVLFEGRLRQAISQDPDVQAYLRNEGQGHDLMVVIGQMQTHLSSVASALLTIDIATTGVDCPIPGIMNARTRKEHERYWT